MTPLQYSEVWKTRYKSKSPHPAEPVVRGELVWKGIHLKNLDIVVDTGADYTLVPTALRTIVERIMMKEGRLLGNQRLTPACTRDINTASQSKVEVPFFKVHLSTELDNFGGCEVGVVGGRDVLLGRDLMERSDLILVFDSVEEMLVKAERTQ